MRWTAQRVPYPQAPSVVVNNSNVVGYVGRTQPNHVLHLILTVLTCGLWLPVWIIVTIASAAGDGRMSGNTAAIIGAAFSGLFILGLASEHPVLAIPLVGIIVAGGIGYKVYLDNSKRRIEQEQLAARADEQYGADLRGDPYGTYGQYPPPPPLRPDARHDHDTRRVIGLRQPRDGGSQLCRTSEPPISSTARPADRPHAPQQPGPNLPAAFR